MISFIVIGRNEGWKLQKCFESILNAIKFNGLSDAEIIYVDSQSSDHSIDIAKAFSLIRIFLIKGICNAAIARNIGAKEAQGDILFFIDGDMEIFPDFLSNVLNTKGEMIYGFLSGFYYNHIYSNDWKLIEKTRYPSAEKCKFEYFEPETGGLFLIRKQLWDLNKGMKNYLFGGEDPDFALRLAKKGIYKLRVSHPMAIHRTLSARNENSFKSIFQKRFLSGQVILFRENFFSIDGLRYLVKKQPSFIMFLLSIVMSFLINFALLIPYVFLQIFRAFKKRKSSFFKRLVYLLSKDIIIFIGFIFYWPKRKIDIFYE